MTKKNGIKEVLLLIIALIVFIAAVYGIYGFPDVVTTVLFVVETVLFLLIVVGLSGRALSGDVPSDEPGENSTDAGADAIADETAGEGDKTLGKPDSLTVVSAPSDATVGTDSVTDAITDASKTEPEVTVKEITKLKTVLFDEDLLEEKEIVDMGEVVKETIAVMEPFAVAAGIRTGYVCAGDVKYTGSKKLLTVMMKNIVDNAVKYMRRSGNMHITVSNVADDIFIVCKDDGLGIGRDELPYIFDLNFQGSNRVSGNGLGLTQARDIVNAYGGTIYAKSAPGAGMGIYIQLPGNGVKSDT
ncbi:MAG: HAMP domain-containing histidine kinase [Lachnospiraceae bacterium]|nr:HAMP domain-containing histidine kinase [Lachnospiraceae bacterium]